VTESTLASRLPCKVEKLVEKGEEVLEDLELDIAALRHAVIHCLDDGQDGAGEGR